MRSKPNTHRDAVREAPLIENRAVTAFVQSRRHLQKAREEARLGLDILAQIPEQERSPLHDDLVRQLERDLGALDTLAQTGLSLDDAS